MRIAAELACDNWLPAEAHPGVYWRRDSTPATFLAERRRDGRTAEDTRAARLQYMLTETMGAPRAFELRRSELQITRGIAGRPWVDGDRAGGGNGVFTVSTGEAQHRSSLAVDSEGRVDPPLVSDDDVLDSFEESVLSPDGLLRKYLECAKLAVRLGSTLFVHGAVDP
mmetsp:Transcript_18266/g.55113  ORF Transcript_18266/g.55113 Transcript_18266/m.55113 type:complete len:168 (+) Transcript_18266:869-1372(+)